MYYYSIKMEIDNCPFSSGIIVGVSVYKDSVSNMAD